MLKNHNLILNKLTKNISTAYYLKNQADTNTLARLITDVTQGQPNEKILTRAKPKKDLER